MEYKRYSCYIIVSLALVLSSCKKLVESPPPTTSLSSDNIYQNDATAISVLTGIYASIAEASSTKNVIISGISVSTALAADELTLYGGPANANSQLVQSYLNQLTPGLSIQPSASGPWTSAYTNIYTTNIALERLAASNTITTSVKQQLIGECHFIRAFFYFYLVNLYGDVPLITNSDYTINAVLSRTAEADVYNQIVTDLVAAQSLLKDSYVADDAKTNTTERVRPNKWAATALLARVYLFMGQWANAEAQATSIINNSSRYSLAALNTAFLKNNSEAIWQLQPVNAGWNTEDARIFVLPLTGPTSTSSSGGYPVYISQQLLGAFEFDDQRKTNWLNSLTVGGTTYYYPYKYKSATLNAAVTEYTMVLRLGEQYLIRAEARANLGESDAVNDLNTIRTRASLPNYSGPTDQASLLVAILHEREVELFTEWGHRWLDLKRTNNINSVMQAVAPTKGTTWSPNWALYPLPVYDIIQDPKLTQNPGY